MNRLNKKKSQIVVLVIGVLLLIVAGGGTAFFLGRTLISPVVVAIISFVPGFALGWCLSGKMMRVTGLGSRPVAILGGGFLLSVLIAFIFLCCNYTLSGEKEYTEPATLTRKFTRTRHRTRRVGRRYVATGEEYKIHYIEVEFSDGTRKEIALGERGNPKLRCGEKLDFKMRRGFFGPRVIREWSKKQIAVPM